MSRELRICFFMQRVMAIILVIDGCVRSSYFLAMHEWSRAIDNSTFGILAAGLYVCATGWQYAVEKSLERR